MRTIRMVLRAVAATASIGAILTVSPALWAQDWTPELGRAPASAEPSAPAASDLSGQPAAAESIARVNWDAVATESLDSAAPALEKRVAELEAAAKKLPRVTLSGVFQADTVAFTQDAASFNTFGRIQNGADFRRARLGAAAKVTENMNAFMQMDFAFFGRPTFTDLWLEVTHLPRLGTVRVGQWKQPFSLEVVSSFRYTTFMERNLAFIPFTPFRHLGVGFYNNAQDLSSTWAASVFTTGQDQFGGSLATDGGVGAAGRVTWLPYYDEPSEGRYYTHLGLGNFWSLPQRDIARFRTVPEIFVGEFATATGSPVGSSGVALPNIFNGTPSFVDTTPIGVNHYDVVGTELLWVNGPLSLQSEMFLNFVGLPGGGSAFLPAGYAQVGYFLTGEHRPYNRVAGAIDRVMPFEDFFRVRDRCEVCRGSGAWEVAGRVSYIDLNDATVNGGQLTDVTAGVNWYLNPYSKIVFNYIHAFLDHPVGGDSNTNVYAMRAQVDF